MDTAVGVSDHYGLAEFVTVKRKPDSPAKDRSAKDVVRSGGPASTGSANGTYLLVARRSIPLIDANLPSSPYHHDALKLSLPDAERLISKVRASVADHCRRVLTEHISAYGVQAVAIQASPYDAFPDSLEEVLASWQLTCAADGMMYRESIAKCAAELGLKVARYPRRSDPFDAAAKALAVHKNQLANLLKDFGRQAGKPWRKEHQVAAASALALLGRT